MTDIAERTRQAADDLSRAEIESQLGTVGVLSTEWRGELIEASLFRIDSRMRSAGLSAREMNELTNWKLDLLGQKGQPTDSPTPTYGQHPAYSRPGSPSIGLDTDTEGSGD